MDIAMFVEGNGGAGKFDLEKRWVIRNELEML